MARSRPDVRAGEASTPGASAVGPPPAGKLGEHSTLQLLDQIGQRLPPQHPAWSDLIHLRERIETIEELNDQARAALEQFEEVVEKLRSPALRLGTWLGGAEPGRALVCVNGTDYLCSVDSDLSADSIHVGERVLCNEAFAVVQALGFDPCGTVARVDGVLSGGRLRIGMEGQDGGAVVRRSDLLIKEKLRPGCEVRLDSNHRVAVEVLGPGRRVERSLQSVQALPWSAVGGQDEAVAAIRDTIELPFLHRELHQRFEHAVPKGFLLHGPPGCGKTLLGRATAYNLARQMERQTGRTHTDFFLHVKGPELLNMWVGESERQVRDLFAQCRERVCDGSLAFLFIDEAEALLGIRRSGRQSGWLSTMVPMFCSEMDGIERLENTVVILASNRADLIDPAILRPGRIDRKIRVRRPDEMAARAIYEIYLRDSLPLAEAGADLARHIARRHFAREESNQFLEVIYRSGRKEMLHRGDLASGAIISAVVERAKSLAIRRGIEGDPETRIGRDDLEEALRLEYLENDLFPHSELTEDWLQLTDFDPTNVVRLGPVRSRGGGGSTRSV